jgi:hypothetical protein
MLHLRAVTLPPMEHADQLTGCHSIQALVYA